MYDKTAVGVLARDYPQYDLGRKAKSFEKIKSLHRRYRGIFEKELPLAYILGARGYGDLAKES